MNKLVYMARKEQPWMTTKAKDDTALKTERTTGNVTRRSFQINWEVNDNCGWLPNPGASDAELYSTKSGREIICLDRGSLLVIGFGSGHLEGRSSEDAGGTTSGYRRHDSDVGLVLLPPRRCG